MYMCPMRFLKTLTPIIIHNVDPEERFSHPLDLTKLCRLTIDVQRIP